MAKPVVNQETCIGCGTCEALCPKVFKVDENGKSQVLEADYEENKACIDEAISNCPVQAISWEEGD